jgi:hypothetical protein
VAVTGAYQTLDDVISGLAEIEASFTQRGDRRAIFATLYGVISTAARENVGQHLFEDNTWVGRYAVAFANFYRLALDWYEAGHLSQVPKAWRLCFDFARESDGLVLQDLLLGVNAHVNNDLPLALNAVSIDPDRASRHRDHTAVNKVFSRVLERATQAVATLYAPGLETADDFGGQLDELASLFSIDVARESAWEAAVALANARSDAERRLTTTLVSARAAVVARLLRAPSLNPTFIAACRQFEQQPNWVALVATCIRHESG